MRFRLFAPLALAFGCGSHPAPPPAAPPPAELPPATAVEPEPAPPKPLPPPPPDATGRTYASWANGAVFYEVFVRSFRDSNGDGMGDLAGLISKLDYLNDGDPKTDGDLGVDALWLMPIFVSPSYHGYDTVDYEHIEPDYGTDKDFTRLAREAHKRGMHIVVDLVLNHSSDKHPWFLESASSPKSKKRDYYTWSATDPGWPQPWNPSGKSWHEKNGSFYYGVFWSGMPDLNYRSPAVRKQAQRIAKLWLDRGVDGFRLDATRHLFETGPGDGQSDAPETHVFLKEFAAALRKSHPKAVLIGENWTDTPVIARYFGDTAAVPGGDELPLNFDFPLAGRIIGAARQGEASVVAGKIAEMQATYPPGGDLGALPHQPRHEASGQRAGRRHRQAQERRRRPLDPPGHALPLLRRGGRPAQRTGRRGRIEAHPDALGRRKRLHFRHALASLLAGPRDRQRRRRGRRSGVPPLALPPPHPRPQGLDRVAARAARAPHRRGTGARLSPHRRRRAGW
jgi:hypothetical protein